MYSMCRVSCLHRAALSIHMWRMQIMLAVEALEGGGGMVLTL